MDRSMMHHGLKLLLIASFFVQGCGEGEPDGLRVRYGLFSGPDFEDLCLGYIAFQGLALHGDQILGSAEGVTPCDAAPGGVRTTAGRFRKNEKYRWPNAIVPYVISPQSTNETYSIHAAMELFVETTKVRFVKRTNEPDFLSFGVDDQGLGLVGLEGMSYMGRQGGMQPIKIVIKEDVDLRGRYVHLIGHALGLGDEHLRFDRDDWVKIQWENVLPEAKAMLQLPTVWEKGYWSTSQEYLADLGPYDYESIMHGGRYELAKPYKQEYFPMKIVRDPTLISTEPAYERRIGQRAKLSSGDVITINQMWGKNLPPDGQVISAQSGIVKAWACDRDRTTTATTLYTWIGGKNPPTVTAEETFQGPGWVPFQAKPTVADPRDQGWCGSHPTSNFSFRVPGWQSHIGQYVHVCAWDLGRTKEDGGAPCSWLKGSGEVAIEQAAPIGRVLFATNGLVRGTACDPDDLHQPIQVRLVWKDAKGREQHLDGLADQPTAQELVGCGKKGSHGFTLEVPDWVSIVDQPLQILGEDLFSRPPPADDIAYRLLASSTLQGKFTATGGMLLGPTSVLGWACDPDAPGQPLDITLKISPDASSGCLPYSMSCEFPAGTAVEEVSLKTTPITDELLLLMKDKILTDDSVRLWCGGGVPQYFSFGFSPGEYQGSYFYALVTNQGQGQEMLVLPGSGKAN